MTKCLKVTTCALGGTKKAVLLHRHSEMSGCDEVKRKTNKRKEAKEN